VPFSLPVAARGAVAELTRRANHFVRRATACPALFEKIFWFSETANQFYIRSHPAPHRGALRNVTNAEREAVDADVPLTNGA